MNIPKQYQYYFSTLIALIAFAGNSVLCRLALQDNAIDANSFTILRLLSGAIALAIIVKMSNVFTRARPAHKGPQTLSQNKGLPWFSSFMLFVYAASFSFAYIKLDAGLGALILFACVQISMICFSIYKKQALSLFQYIGLIVAFSGLLYLVYSQQASVDELNFSMSGFILMVISGVAWAAYTLLGKNSVNPTADTSVNFTTSCIFLLPLSLLYIFVEYRISPEGLLLAVASGALSSGIGYAIWYFALRGLQAVQAGVIQLLVPVIAALGGTIWIGEAISIELIISQFIILSGIALVLFTKKTPSK